MCQNICAFFAMPDVSHHAASNASAHPRPSFRSRVCHSFQLAGDQCSVSRFSALLLLTAIFHISSSATSYGRAKKFTAEVNAFSHRDALDAVSSLSTSEANSARHALGLAEPPFAPLELARIPRSSTGGRPILENKFHSFSHPSYIHCSQNPVGPVGSLFQRNRSLPTQALTIVSNILT